MELLMNSTYNQRTPLNFSLVNEVSINNSIDFGLPGDVIADHQNLLPDNSLITSPQNDDTFLLEARTTIPLKSAEVVSWYANDIFLATGSTISFMPTHAGTYTIKSTTPEGHAAHIRIYIAKR